MLFFDFRKYRLCEAFGIPVYLDPSLGVLLLLFVMDFHSLGFGLAMGIVLMLSIVLHELGHALTAQCFGYRAREITLSLLGGCASFSNLPRKPHQELLTALAGPLTSFAIAGVAWVTLLAVQPAPGYFWLGLTYAFWMNVTLGAFNLLPGFPLDGGRILRAGLATFSRRATATKWAMKVGRVVAVMLAVRGVHSMLNGGGWGFMSILIGWMIWQEGKREYMQTVAEEGWGGRWQYSARVSAAPYGGDEDETEIRPERAGKRR